MPFFSSYLLDDSYYNSGSDLIERVGGIEDCMMMDVDDKELWSIDKILEIGFYYWMLAGFW